MSKKTVNGLLAHCKKAKNWKYVYGAKGTVLNLNGINKLRNTYGANMVPTSDNNKAGFTCCDCSGLISSYTGIVRNSSTYKTTALEVVTIAQLKANWQNYIGWGLWMNGHIGVVSDTVGYYYAMDGSSRNWVHYPLSKNKFVYAIKLKDIDYSANIAVPSNAPVSAHYCVKADGCYYAEVKNLDDYAGVESVPITDVAIKFSDGKCKYRVHVLGGSWLPWVTGYDWTDENNGYAGIGEKIDAIQIVHTGGKLAKYRVSSVGSEQYYDFVTNDSDYAGVYGKEIDKIQIYVV